MRFVMLMLLCASLNAQASNKLMQRCQRTDVINKTEVWTKYDQWTLDRARHVCKTRYIACLKKFFKMDTLKYRAICRKPGK